MLKKFLIFLAIVFSIGILGSEVCLAVLNPPYDLDVPEVGQRSARFTWQWDPGGGTIQRFEISYREAGETEWTTPETQPDGTLKGYTMRGFEKGTTYEWTIMAVATDPNANSSKARGPNFTTERGEEEAVCGNGKCEAGEDAQNCPEDCGGGGGGGRPELLNPLMATTLEELFTAIINFLFYLAMGLAPILIIWAAFLILTAGGKAEQVNKGKTIILWTLIAVAIVLFAKGLPSVVKGILGG